MAKKLKMEIFVQEINSIKYTVHYTFTKQYQYPVDFHVEISKIIYKKMDKSSDIEILSYWDLKNIIEQELHKPVI